MAFLFQRFRHLCEIAILLAGIASLLGLAGSWHWAADLAAHFPIQYFICGILCALVFLLFKSWRWGMAALLLAGVNAAVLLPVLPSGKSAEPVNGAQLRVVSYNLYTDNQNRQEGIRWLEASEADVLFLMETNQDWWVALKPLRAKYPHHAIDIREDNFGMVLLSRIPWESLDWMKLPQGLPGLHARFLLERETELHLFGLHPPPPMGAVGFAMREQYLDAVANRIQNIFTPVVVVGDLNTTPWAPSFRRFVRPAGLERQTGGMRPTWHAFGGLAGIPIDHVLTTNGAHILSHTSGPRMGSDHYPQIMEISRPEYAAP